MKPLLIGLLLFLFNKEALLSGCQKKYIGGIKDDDPRIVCVCNATFCDDVPTLRVLKNFQVAVFTSDITGKRFEQTDVKFMSQALDKSEINVKLYPSKTFQKIYGFGGAFTDAAGINIARLSGNAQINLLKSYFGVNGIEYTIGRIPIASCDFSTHEYSYADQIGDFNLTSFNLTEEDLKYKIPFIQTALKLSKNNLKLFGSPWSAPAWMKSNGHMKGGGTLKGDIGGEYYVTWSDYFIRFLEEYHKNGIKIWGITLQNEPYTGLDPLWGWQTMYLGADMQREFVKNLIGPKIRSHPILNDTKIMVHDDARSLIPTMIDPILNDSTTAKFVDGIAFHWYADAYCPVSNVAKTHEHFPDHFILMTEACAGFEPWALGPIIGNWTRGELYAKDIIQNLMNWVVGWVDWNLVLNEQGGPNWVKNFVDSPILVNNTQDEFYKQPMFYFMGHFSKFVRPNSVRIARSMNGNFSDAQLDVIVFKTQTSQRVLVVNNRDSKTYTLTVQDPQIKNKIAKVEVEPRSIKTLVWNKPK